MAYTHAYLKIFIVALIDSFDYIRFLAKLFSLRTLKIFSSAQFSRSVVSDSLRPHELQHTRPPHPSPTPGVHSDSRPSSQWCHPAISSSVVPFFSCPQSFPASQSFPMSQLFAWGGQSTGVSALASLLHYLLESSAAHEKFNFSVVLVPFATYFFFLEVYRNTHTHACTDIQKHTLLTAWNHHWE